MFCDACGLVSDWYFFFLSEMVVNYGGEGGEGGGGGGSGGLRGAAGARAPSFYLNIV